jgi:flagella basal body P-ring formation protein FlgA
MILRELSKIRQPERKVRFLFLAGLLITAFPGIAAAEAGASSQVSQAVRQAAVAEARALLGQDAANATTLFGITLPPEASTLSPCPHRLKVATPPGKRQLWRLRYDVSCAGQEGWPLSVVVKPTVTLSILTATRTLERGEILSSQDVELSPQDVTLMNGNYFRQPQEVEGQTVKRRIASAQIVTQALLDQPVMVSRGQSVLIIARQHGIEARTDGEALKNGRKGEIIRVRNNSSQRIIDVQVEAPGVVRTLPRPQ